LGCAIGWIADDRVNRLLRDVAHQS
jgi:hypothetical protein